MEPGGRFSKDLITYWARKAIGHLRITFGFFFKTSPGAHPFIRKLAFICMWMKTNFHMKGWAPELALKKRPKVIRKWPIETMTRLPWKAALLRCFRCKERQNKCQVSKLEMCSYWRYKRIYVTQKVSERSRNEALVIKSLCLWTWLCLWLYDL